jgi:peptide/nickel transport system permease protein
VKTFVARRLANALLLLIGVSFLTFWVIDLAPGDPATILEDETIPREIQDQMRREFGLDRPFFTRYGMWLERAALHGDFGTSISYRQPVFALIAPRLGSTLLLALAAAALAWGLAIPLGVFAAVRQHSGWDRAAAFAAFLGLSIPEVVLALGLLLMAGATGWFPIGGMRSPEWDLLSPAGRALDILHHLFLPALVLGVIPMAARMRQMRASLLDVLRLDYVTTARAKGLPERTVIWKHAVRNALNPLITLFGFTLAKLLSGALVIEVIFSWPGIGRLTYEAVYRQDYFLVQASLLMASLMLILGNLVADLLLAAADPRVRFS